MEQGGEQRQADERFAACLDRLFKHRARLSHVCYQTCLKDGIGASKRTVGSWMRSERAPKLDSAWPAEIARHLELNDVERNELFEAQSRSLRDGPKPRRRHGDTPGDSGVRRFIDGGRGADANQPRRWPGAEAIPKALGEGIVEDVIALLKNAPSGAGTEDDSNTITLTWQGRDSIEMSEPQQARFTAALQKVLQNGWHVHHLCRLDGDLSRTVQLVQMMLDFFGSGAYAPYRFIEYGTLSAPQDLLVIPGYAALWLFSAHSPHRVDSGVVALESDQIRDAAAHARQLWALTTPLVRAYFKTDDDEDANAAYVQALQMSEAEPGGRIAVMDGLTAITQPERWFDLQQPSPYTAFPTFEAWRRRHAHRRMSITPFKRIAENDDYYDICTESAVVELSRSGVYHSRLGDTFQPEKQLTLEHLHNIVELLSHTRYHLALVSDYQRYDKEPNSIHIDTAWTVTGDNSVFLETSIPDVGGRPKAASVHITERTVAAGFREYFKQMWSRIPPSMSANADVIRFLEGKIAELERDIADAGE